MTKLEIKMRPLTKEDVEKAEKPEMDFRREHYGHVILLRQPPCPIGEVRHIACEDCDTEWLDVSAYDLW